MNIKFTGKYKSLNSFEWNNIPKLVVITGLNGAGKSQLLELIDKHIKETFTVPGLSVGAPSIKLEISGALFQAPEATYLKGEWVLSDSAEIDLGKLQNLTATLHRNMVGSATELQSMRSTNFKKYSILMTIKKNFEKDGKTGNQITVDDFRKALEKTEIAEDITVVQGVSEFFYNYKLSSLDLKIKGYTDEEIVKAIGAKPWDVLREIIKEANLPFQITDPNEMGIYGTYKLTITKTTNGEIVKFEDLSSGERVLFSLAFLLFNSQEAKRFPKLLLLDEPDAHLHPKMIDQLLKVLKNVLVDKYGVQVILTTHSPSTVALSSDESIYVMDAAVGYPTPADKDEAISSLLSGIPNLYVRYEDRRQVFVESDNDVNFYEKLYKRVFGWLNRDVNLNFISSGTSVTDKNGRPISNCGQVITITSTLTNAGNPHVYGIIDYDDGKNKGDDHIIVLGEGNRYSIENYIFDPVLVGMLLLREKFVTPTEVGLPDFSYNDSSMHTAENLQKLTEYVTGQVEASVSASDNQMESCELLSGNKVDIPKWYLMNQGHDLENLLVKVFPKLNEIKKGQEAKLKIAIIEKVIDDFPDLLSIDIVKAFESVQK